MNTRDMTPAATHLRKGEILRLHNGRGQRIESVHAEITTMTVMNAVSGTNQSERPSTPTW